MTSAEIAGGGHGEVNPSIARFWPARTEVRDYEFIDPECEDLIECAKSRLMYGHRLCHHKHPFEDEITELELAAAKYATSPKTMQKRRERWAAYYENYKKGRYSAYTSRYD